MKIFIVIANYYPEISKELFYGAVKVLKKNGVKNYKKKIVPGIFEIPTTIAKNANNYDGFIIATPLSNGVLIENDTK